MREQRRVPLGSWLLIEYSARVLLPLRVQEGRLCVWLQALISAREHTTGCRLLHSETAPSVIERTRRSKRAEGWCALQRPS